MCRMTQKLKIGDKVLWSGGHGTQPLKTATVENIEFNGKQYGSLPWKYILNSGEILIDLDNGHWCYGKQVKKSTEFLKKKNKT